MTKEAVTRLTMNESELATLRAMARIATRAVRDARATFPGNPERQAKLLGLPVDRETLEAVERAEAVGSQL